MNFIIKLLDTVFAILLGCIILPFILILFFGSLVLRFIPLGIWASKNNSKKCNNLLRLVPGNMDDILKKDVLWMLRESDENGYFDHVYNLLYPAEKSREVSLGQRHTVVEIGKVLPFLKKRGFYSTSLLINGAYFIFRIILMRRFVKNNIDIIKGQDPDHMGFAALILHLLTGIPFCVSVHADHDKRYEIAHGGGVYLLFGLKPLTDLIRRIPLSSSPLVMVIRESLSRYVMKMGVKEENIAVTPHGIHLEWFDTAPDYDLRRSLNLDHRKLVVICCRLSSENYIKDIIDIADRVRRKVPQVLFLIIGDGIERSLAEARSTEKGLDNNIMFTGYQPIKKVIQFRKMADVNLCLMGGFSLIEAAASGRPIISYDVEWHYELVKDGETGYLIKEHDIAEASMAIVKLINDPILSKRLGDNARILAKNYSAEAASRKRVEYYDALIKNFKPLNNA